MSVKSINNIGRNRLLFLTDGDDNEDDGEEEEEEEEEKEEQAFKHNICMPSNASLEVRGCGRTTTTNGGVVVGDVFSASDKTASTVARSSLVEYFILRSSGAVKYGTSK
jgi:hypothetical protein